MATPSSTCVREGTSGNAASQDSAGVVHTLSQLVNNRRRFFQLIELLEQQSGIRVNALELLARIDSDYDGREQLNRTEAFDLLLRSTVR